MAHPLKPEGNAKSTGEPTFFRTFTSTRVPVVLAVVESRGTAEGDLDVFAAPALVVGRGQVSDDPAVLWLLGIEEAA